MHFDNNEKCHYAIGEKKFKFIPKSIRVGEKYLSAVATSVSCERLFSKAGNINSKKRSRPLQIELTILSI
jgi:hypothetical protein